MQKLEVIVQNPWELSQENNIPYLIVDLDIKVPLQDPRSTPLEFGVSYKSRIQNNLLNPENWDVHYVVLHGNKEKDIELTQEKVEALLKPHGIDLISILDEYILRPLKPVQKLKNSPDQYRL